MVNYWNRFMRGPINECIDNAALPTQCGGVAGRGGRAEGHCGAWPDKVYRVPFTGFVDMRWAFQFGIPLTVPLPERCALLAAS